MKLMNYITASFDTHRKGASARKLSAFVAMLLIIYCHRYIDSSNAVEAIAVDCGLLFALLGIRTLEKLKTNIDESSNQ